MQYLLWGISAVLFLAACIIIVNLVEKIFFEENYESICLYCVIAVVIMIICLFGSLVLIPDPQIGIYKEKFLYQLAGFCFLVFFFLEIWGFDFILPSKCDNDNENEVERKTFVLFNIFLFVQFVPVLLLGDWLFNFLGDNKFVVLLITFCAIIVLMVLLYKFGLKNRLIGISFLIVAQWLFIVCVTIGAFYIPDRDIDDALERKIIEINDLTNNLKYKNEEIAKLILNYENGISELKKEILEEKDKKGILSFQAAQNNTLINKDLLLIQRKQAYIKKLCIIKVKVEQGVEDLRLLKMKAEDDLKLVRVLNKKETRELVADINSVIDKYLPDVEELMINEEELELVPAEQIWQEISQ